MCQRTRFHIPDQIGLGDEIFPLGWITIRGQSNSAILPSHSAIGIDVQVDFVIVAI